MAPLTALVLAAALALPGQPRAPDPVGVWPLQPQPAVVRGFDPPDSPYGAGHRGVDLLGTVGQPVRASLPGTVSFAGLLAGRGVVVVDHGSTRTTYEPVVPTVAVGAPVAAGAQLGTLTSAARTASRAPACTGAGSPTRPTSTRCAWWGPVRSGCSRSGGTSRSGGPRPLRTTRSAGRGRRRCWRSRW